MIDALSAESRGKLLSCGSHLDLPQSTILFQPHVPADYVHFLTSGVASEVVTVAKGDTAEVNMQGSEGAIGVLDLLGNLPPVVQCLMQTNGSAIRVALDDMKRLFGESAEIRGRILESVQQQTLTVNQIAACNRLHLASERLARWLLTASDRVGSDTLGLTQEAVSAMLGTRRTTVALAAGALQRSGMIRYRRGIVKILDRQALTDAACECYRVAGRLVEGLYQTRLPDPAATA